MTSAFDFEATGIDGSAMPLSRHEGSVLLLVNTASECGFTPQYDGLQALWQRHRDAGLVVIGFPCNQFGGQEPDAEPQIAAFCRRNHGVDFPITSKVDVNGPNADPLWKWLKSSKPGLLGSEAIKWNFTKFLVGRDGQVLSRHAPTESPSSLEPAIERALAGRAP